MKRITHDFCGLVAATLLLCISNGCERPPRAEGVADAGPPKVMHLDPESPEGKALAAARKQQQENAAPVAAPTGPDGAKPRTPPGSEPSPPAATPPATGPTSPAQPPVSGATPGAAPADSATPAEGKERVTAETAAKEKAGKYGSGLVATPLGVLNSVRDRVNDIEVETALKYYVIEKGKPHDTAEFFDKVVHASHLRLKKLPEGQKYFYDPSFEPYGALMIERTAEKPK